MRFTDPQGFGEKYGYGVMYDYELYETGDGPIDGGFEDPNQEYIMGLSPAEQEAFNRALYGVQVDGPARTDADSGEYGRDQSTLSVGPRARSIAGVSMEKWAATARPRRMVQRCTSSISKGVWDRTVTPDVRPTWTTSPSAENSADVVTLDRMCSRRRRPKVAKPSCPT